VVPQALSQSEFDVQLALAQEPPPLSSPEVCPLSLPELFPELLPPELLPPELLPLLTEASLAVFFGVNPSVLLLPDPPHAAMNTTAPRPIA